MLNFIQSVRLIYVYISTMFKVYVALTSGLINGILNPITIKLGDSPPGVLYSIRDIFMDTCFNENGWCSKEWSSVNAAFWNCNASNDLGSAACTDFVNKFNVLKDCFKLCLQVIKMLEQARNVIISPETTDTCSNSCPSRESVKELVEKLSINKADKSDDKESKKIEFFKLSNKCRILFMLEKYA